MSTRLNRLDHVVIRVGDVQESRRWYEDILGFRTLDGPTDRASLSRNGRTLDLVLVGGGSGVESFAFGVEDEAAFDEYERWLKGAGVDYERTDGLGRPGIAALLRHPLPERAVVFEVALAHGGRATGVTETEWDGQSPFPTDIDHVNLIANDVVRASTERVRDKLGLALTDVLVPADEWTLTFLRTQDLHHEPGFVAMPDPGVTLHHFALWMHGAEHHRMFADHLASNGQSATMEWPGIARHGGPSNNLVIYLFDPSGNRIELWAEMGTIPEGWETAIWGPDDIPETINRWVHGWAPESFLTVGS